jgi:N-acetylneuraminic acid mutarotase
MLKKLLFFPIFLGLLTAGCSSQSPWVKKADLPAGRWMLSTSVVGGKIYAIGGLGGELAPMAGSAAAEVYDPASNTWLKKKDMLTGRGAMATTVVAGKIYAIGGTPDFALPPMASVDVYDPTMDTWIRKTEMPDALDGVSASEVGGKIYVIGGAKYDLRTQERISQSTVEEYDPISGTWTRKNDMPTARNAPASCGVGSKVYVLGGFVLLFESATPAFVTSAVEVYDPANDTWTKRASMPEPRSGAAAVALNGNIYVFGGTDSDSGQAFSSVFEYDPVKDHWKILPDMPFRRQVMSASVVNGKIYVMGGSKSSFPYDTLDLSVWEFSP